MRYVVWMPFDFQCVEEWLQILKMIYLPAETDIWISEKFRVGGTKVRLLEYFCSILMSSPLHPGKEGESASQTESPKYKVEWPYKVCCSLTLANNFNCVFPR